MTQLESDRGPALFCQTPIWEFSLSSLRHVRDGDGDLQLFRSFAPSTAERDWEEEEDDDDDAALLKLLLLLLLL